MTENMEIDKYWYWMCNIKGLSNRKILKLLENYPDPRILYEAEERKMKISKEISKEDIEKIVSSKKIGILGKSMKG